MLHTSSYTDDMTMVFYFQHVFAHIQSLLVMHDYGTGISYGNTKYYFTIG